ncbi:ExeM/NucH family extracellular endonuclease [Synechococcus sp. CS-1332]|uniref:ExeM/NucH family extracellular endonuclease n=1 Tax=Synechococcus sp. CS-1332 TaxID=2847972 RepID=UPI00223AAA96|nr:ExeM/NucH family extracellular endonuclease [Synechococcus sp. CS-1332]
MAIDFAGSYAQDFDTLPTTTQAWQDDVTLTGWFTSRTGTGGTIVPATGSSNAGGLYSFGASGSTERALGSLGSGNAAVGNVSWGVSFRNQTGAALSTLYIEYVGEQWRYSGTAAAQTVDVAYGTSTQPGIWLNADSLDFTSPIISGSAGALDGNAVANRILMSGSLTNLALQPGDTLQIRWTDPDHPGSDHGLAIDDFKVSVTPFGSPSPAGLTLLQSSGSTGVVEGGNGDDVSVRLDRQPTADVTVTLAEPAGNSQLALQPTQLVFTSANWSIPQTITLSAVDDTAVEGNHASSLQFTLVSTDPAYNGLVVTPLPVAISDNDGAITRIHSIQGSSASFNPAFAGLQTIEGVVVGAFPGANGLNGFFVQEEDADADADPLTSEGIFVFDPSGRFGGSVGSKVRVTGDVREFTSGSSGIAGPYSSSLTQLYDPSLILDLGTVALPAAVSVALPVADVTLLERFEGMRVQVSASTGELIVTDTFKLGRFGQVGLSAGERLGQFTQINAPSVSGYADYLADLLTKSIILDDGSSRQNPDPVLHSRGGQPLSAVNTLRGGDSIGSITGVLDERFEGYRVQTLTPAAFSSTNPRPSAPPAVGGDLKVGTFNVLNFFSDLDTNAVVSIPGGVSFEPRGANSALELSRQRQKLITAILGLDADVLGLVEIENDGPATLTSLVDSLNAVAGAGTYAFVDDSSLIDDPNPALNAVGTDAIKVAILYKPGALLPSGAARSFAESDPVNPIFDRPPVAQTFETPTGGRFTMVVNHFKSKGSSAGRLGDADQGDGQGLSNATRVAQSQALLDFVDDLRNSSGDTDVLVLGDLNAYGREDPITTLTNGGFVNLFDDDSYSYQFNGQWGSLDHALATASLSAQVTGATKWHINSDEPVVLDYNTEFKSSAQINSFFNADPFRTSDHDPLLIGLALTPTTPNPMITSGTSFAINEANSNGLTGPSSSATPYITSSNPQVQFTALFTVGDEVNGYRMVGIPDGMGAFDNGDGSFTLLMNHELANERGIARAHGQAGAFVSRWVIDKASLEVVSIQDFLPNGTSIYLSNNDPGAGTAHSAYLAAATTVISRLCSADLAPVSAYQYTDPVSGTVYGTDARLFQSGEESGGSVTGVGPEATTLFGRQFVFVATDDANTPLNENGTAWELPHGGLFAWENNIANPLAQRKTIVMGLDDSNGGQLYLWVGNKQTSGNVVERAGLTRQGPDDNLFVVRVPSLATLDGSGVPAETLDGPVAGAFSLVNLGDVSALTLNGLEAASDTAGATQFLRPEDGQWDPANPADFYFVTTSRYDQTKDGVGSQVGRSRLYRLRFSDITNPEVGGTITALLDGTEAGNMFDNFTIAGGKVILQEDVGNQQHLGKIWSYDIAADSLTELGAHDRQRFGDVGVAAVAPYNQDEESSGVIDVSSILGEGTFLLNVQAHYPIPGELAEGGQLLLMRTNAISGQPLVTTVTATDPQNDPLTFSISGGADAADFSIDASTGALRFALAPNAENPADADGNNVYLVEVSVSDGNSPAVSQTLEVTVNPVNESPLNTTATAVTVVENSTAVTTASGSDPEGASLAFAISGGADAARFTIDPNTGVLRFLAAPNFEAPTDNGANNSYFVGVTVSDGVNAPVNRTVVVSVTDVKEAPAPSNALVIKAIGSYASGSTGVAEIIAHDPASQKLFSLNGALNRLDVLSIANPNAPALVGSIDLSAYGAVPNSVAVKNGLIAVAMEASPKTEAGKVVFFSTAGVFQSQVSVGAQPDMLTFTPDGLKVLVANEGEPNVGDTINPEGSISIISLAGGVAAASVTTASFSAFNGKEAQLRGQGVRISAGKSFAVDAEPESIAVSPDGSTARITLQENNAVAVLDLATNTITAIQALGLKDYSTGLPQVKSFDFDAATLPAIGTTATGQTLKLGGFSGLHFEGIDVATGNLKFITNTDRGPNGEPSDVLPAVPGNERPFALPAFSPELVRFQLNQGTGAISITSRIALKRADGTPLSGLPNLQSSVAGGGFSDEVGVDLNGNQLTNDPFGADVEGIVVAPDGSFWLPDEYRPAIYHFDASGKLIERFIPTGTAAGAGQPAGTFGTEALPSVYGQFRRANRGFEAIAMEGDKIYAFIQTNLDNPGTGVRNNGVIRILEFNSVTKQVSGEFVYVMRDTSAGGNAKTDKIGDAVALGGGRFLVVERDDRTGTDSNKLIYEINLKGATNVLGTPLATATSGTTLESLNPAALAANSIRAVDKRLVVNAAAIGYTGISKLEGLALVDADTIALINDNDFQLAGTIAGNGSAPLNPTPEPIRLGLIDFNLSNGLDASDRDVDGSSGAGGKISVKPQPVFGMAMPDGIAAYTVGGKKYFITANEGDDRDDFINPDETIRVGSSSYVLDPTSFPNAAALKNNALLGRLTVSAIDGDIDGDGDIDRIQAYGARSFTIWDEAGNRVFDSGDALELITAAQVPALFNSDGVAGSFDTRSDNKGPEPEGVAIGEINGRLYAFVGLERVGGFITYDVTDPIKPVFVTYTNPAANAAGTPGQTDRAPEGIAFINAADSPSGQPLVVTGNEVSGTTTLYSVTIPAAYTLQLLSYYGESGLLGVQTAPILGALIDKFDDQYANTLKLGEGDTFIPGPWLIGGADPSLSAVPGIGSTALARPDIAIFNAFGTDVSALGNHEFDLGSPVLQGAFAASGAWGGAQFPFITANLNFAADNSLRGLADATIGGSAANAFAGQEASAIKGKIAPYTVVTEGGESIGIVGATTFDLLSKSSPNGTVPKDDADPSTSDLQEVAVYVQAAVDALRARGINKIVMVDQLDTLDRNKALAPLLRGVDVMVAGGGHERLGDANDVPVAFNGHDADFIPTDRFPIVTAGADGKPTLIITTDTEFTYLGRLVVDFDANGEIILSNLNSVINGAYAATEASLQTAYGTTQSAAEIIAGSVIGTKVKAISDAINNVIVSKDGTIFGYTDVYLEGDRVFGRTQEVNLGDITADANLAKAQAALGAGAILASLKNGGGIRASIGSVGESGEKLPPAASSVKPFGAISQLDIENALRFDNKLMVFDATPQQLLNILEFAAGLSSGPAQQNGGYAQVGGVHFSYDPTRPAGQKLQDVAIYDESGNLLARIADNGQLLTGAPSTISVVTLNFTANGGDSYPIKANGANFRYLLANGTLSAPVDESLDFTAASTFTSLGLSNADLLGEQKAFQDFLLANHATPETAFATTDTPASLDRRIQNLQLKPQDTVLSLDTLPNGVASGDVDQDSVVLWTRSTALGQVKFEYSTTADFAQIAGSATASVTNPNQPVKVEISGLSAGTDYFYRVTDAAGSVAKGRFETAAAAGHFTGLRFGISGDWRGELAPYPSIGNAAGKDLDFFVALGDTIYGDVGSNAVLNPDGSRKSQATTLDEFRAKHDEVYSVRYGVNSFEDLRGSTAIYATIDDHEVTNDFAGGAAAASDPRFGTTQGRINDTELFDNGLTAFQEYNPIRDVFNGSTGDSRTAGERDLYRFNTFGSDAASFLLDTRSFRDPELVAPNTANPADVARFLNESLTLDRTLLGADQLSRVKADLLKADRDGITWKFVMVPEPIQELGIYNTDAFEGYAKERKELLKFIETNGIRNVVFVAADIHGTMVNNLTYTETVGGPRVATDTWEITTGSVAYSKPFGQTVVDFATAASLLTPQQKAFYDSLPILPDTDAIPNDKDDFLRNAFQSLVIGPAGYDPIGLNANLAAGSGVVGSFDVNASLIQGDYVAAHTYGWTQFDIDQATQKLTVTTYGIDPYSEAELQANQASVLAREPRIVSQFTVEANQAPRLALGTDLIANPTAFRFDFGSNQPAAVALQARFFDAQGQPIPGTQTLATAIGQASGLPAGFDADTQSGVLGDGQRNGRAEFFLTNLSSGATTPLTLSGSAQSGFVLAGGGFNITASLTPEALEPEVYNTSFAVGGEELIGLDLSGLTNQLTLEVEIFREAAYNGTLGLYLSNRSTGDVIDPLTGAVASGGSWAGSEANYRRAAVANALWTGTTPNNSVASLTASVTLGQSLNPDDYVLLPFIQVANTRQTYVAGASRNADNVGHIQLLGTNTFGFEDLRGGGDADFDDLILRVNSL